MNRLHRLLLRTGRGRAALVVLVLLLGSLWLLRPHHGKDRLTADFVSSVGVYQGSEVRLMGVPIGRVLSVTPHGDHVRIVMEYDDRHRLAADAKAIIVSPSVVADRFVQVTPPYDGNGRPLPDGAVLGTDRTRVPVELDRVFRTAHDLLDALGPQGANDNGAVNRFLGVAADDLRGNGTALGKVVQNLGAAAGTLGAGSDDFFASVTALEKLTGTLAAGDPQVRTFNRRMARVLGVLADERGSLGQVLDNLATTFHAVTDFVHRNRAALVSDVHGLVGVSHALVAERGALEKLVREVPLGIDNLRHTWDPQMLAARSRTNELQILKRADNVICDSISAAGVPGSTLICNALHALLGPVKK